ncbi:MAG: branched-chain amino acid ABC transporter substrate-binding protein [Actinomycetota bacterium]
MRKVRGTAWLALLLSLTLVAAACGDGGESTDEAVDGQAAGACSSDSLTPLAGGASGDAAPAAADSPSAGFSVAQTNPTLTIGAFGDRTGGNSQIVVPAHKAMELAIKQANEAGDLPVTLQFQAIDNREGGGDPAIPIAQRFIDDDSVIAVLGGAFSGEVASTAGLFSEAGLLFFTPLATRPSLTDSGFTTFFRGVANDNAQGAAIIEAFGFLGCTRVALVDDKSTYGQGLGDVAEAEAAQAGMEVVLNEGIEPTEDYTSLVDSVIAADPQALFYAGYGTEFAPLARQLREKGYEGLIASGDGSKLDDIGQNIGPAEAEGVVLTCPCPDINLSADPRAQQFVTDFKALHNEAPGPYSVEGYDITNVVIEAIKVCGADGAAGVTRTCVLDKVRATSFDGIGKDFEFEANGEVKEGAVSVFVVRGGVVREVGTVDTLV